MTTPRRPARAGKIRAPGAQPGALPLSEDDFQRRVIDTAKLHGWKVTHFRAVKLPSGKWGTPLQGDAGFPDLALARGGYVILAELKTDTGTVEPAQAAWMAQIGTQHGRVWRPRDWPDILAELAPRNRQSAGVPPCCNPHSMG